MKTFAFCTLAGLMAAGYWMQATALDDAPATTPAASDVATAQNDGLDALRQELLRLTEQATHDMDEAELRAEVDALRRRVADSAADEQLEQIRQQLAQLIEQYPESAAALQASAMLNVSDATPPVVPIPPTEPRLFYDEPNFF